MQNKKRRWIAVTVPILLIALCVMAYVVNRTPVAPQASGGGGKPPAGGAPQMPPTAVELASVTSSQLILDAVAVGSLRSNESVVLRPETAGRIASIGFKDGELVAKGALLVSLDAAMQSAELEQAQATRELARSTQQRNHELFEKKFISRQALDASASSLRVQEATVSLAEAKLAKTRIRAPFAGIVGIRNVSVGDYVKEGQDLINLEDVATLKVDFRLPENFFSMLRIGQKLELSVDALPNERFVAELDAMDPLIDSGGRSISLRARLPNEDRKLRPGMFVRVRVVFDVRDDALMIPEQALVTDINGVFVYRVTDGTAEKVNVKTGGRRDAKVEITEGLKAGDVVVVAGQLKLRPGAPVRDVAQAAGKPAAAPPAPPAPPAPAPAQKAAS